MIAKGINEELGINRFNLVYIYQIANKDLVYSSRHSAQCYVTT